MSRKKIITTTLLVLVLMASGIGYYLYNKGPVDVQDSSSVKTNAAGLYVLFIKDLAAAQKNYTGRILEVSGEVHDISINQQQKKILLLKTNSDGAYVNCTMEENIENVHANDKVNVKGICSGIGEGDVDLGIKGDVYLTRCYLVK
ncbi:MAG: hypothetical protein ABI402_14510 [Ferruginibacter sp.]